MLWHVSVRVLLTVGLLLAAFPAPISFAQPEPPAPERGPRQIVDEDWLALEAGLAAEQPAADDLPDGIASAAGKLVYQSFRDGNWEIYYSGDEGTGLVRLTADPAADVEPRLSPDASQVVFTSKRTGNYELFVINVDGTGLRQLTNHPAVDGSPAWSPDGKQIAFSSDRDGNAEIYVMNADGSGLVRLTNAPGYDDEPAWSPDGRQIAFTSRRTGDEHSYYIWVMNADGGGVRQLSSHWYSQNPIWSPDGSLIFFDVANDRGWSRLMFIPSGGGTAAPMPLNTPPGLYYHAWMNSVGFQGALYYTVVLYRVNGDRLEIQDFLLYSGGNTQFGITSSGPLFGSLNGFADWQNGDRLAPTARVETPGPVQMEKTMGGLWGWLRVIATDMGGAGVGRVELQARALAQSTWIPGACGGNATSGFSCGIPAEAGDAGQRIRVRVRAIDRMGNVEPWPAGDGVEIIPFAVTVQGVVIDNRSLPVFGATIDASPVLDARTSTDPFGRFGLRFYGSSFPYQYTVSAAGVGGPNSRTLSSQDINTPTDYGVRLSPVQNLITNGSFENGTTGWEIPTPGTTTIRQNTWNSGSSSLFFDPRPVSGPPIFSGYGFLDAAYRPDGVAILNSLNQVTTFRFCSTAGGSCTDTPVPVETVHGWTFGPDGTLWIVGSVASPDERRLIQRTSAGVWQAPVSLPNNAGGSFGKLLAGSDGRLHWLRTDLGGNLLHAIRATNGTWSDAAVIDQIVGGAAVLSPSGNIELVGCRGAEAIALIGSPTGVWPAPPTVVAGVSCQTALLSVDAQGIVYAQWRGLTTYAQTFAARAADGVWRTAANPEGSAFSNDISPNAPLYWLVAPPNGAGPLSVVNVEDQRLNIVRLQSDGTWSARVRLGDYRPEFGLSATVFALDETGQRILLSGRRVNSNSMADVSPPAVQDWRYDGSASIAAAAEQALTIPVSWQAPTFSFFAAYPDIGSRFRVAVRDAGGATTIAMSSASPGVRGALTYQWVDLTRWRGQTISVIFQVLGDPSHVGGVTPPIVIDDVELGDWRTPIIGDVQPQLMETGGVTLTVSGLNLNAQTEIRLGDIVLAPSIEVSPGTYQVIVPADMPVGAWTLTTRNSDGAMGAYGLPVRVGRQVFLPALSNWSQPRP